MCTSHPRVEKKSMHHRAIASNKALCLLIILAFVSVTQICVAQTVITTGTVRGSVVDASGAVIPGAQVTLKYGTDRISRTTNAAGLFTFPSEPVGSYELDVAAAG